MDPESQERFEGLDMRLTAQEEKTIAQDKSLSAIRTLLLQGARMMVENKRELDGKIAALIDAQLRTEEAHKRTEESLRAMEESLKRFFDRSGNGHRA